MYVLYIMANKYTKPHVESIKTPRFHGGSLLGVMRESPMFMPICWFWLVLLWVVITISSVLSSFSFKSLLVIQTFRSLIQASRQDIVVSFDIDTPGWKNIQLSIGCVKMKVQPIFSNNIPKRVVHIVNTIGSGTEPWGYLIFQCNRCRCTRPDMDS